MGDVQDQSPVGAAPPLPETTASTAVLSYREGAPYEGPVVGFTDFRSASNAGAVRIDAGDDVRALVPYLGALRLIEVAFAKYRDGRGYSSARILREAGYAGELRAAGDVLVDQIRFMLRVGFDSFAPARPLDPMAVERALGRYAYEYQKAADGRPPVWELRHG
ncbi:MAG: DUF934 domain-containing protein [Janthinobacterium lividum]